MKASALRTTVQRIGQNAPFVRKQSDLTLADDIERILVNAREIRMLLQEFETSVRRTMGTEPFEIHQNEP